MRSAVFRSEAVRKRLNRPISPSTGGSVVGPPPAEVRGRLRCPESAVGPDRQDRYSGVDRLSTAGRSGKYKCRAIKQHLDQRRLPVAVIVTPADVYGPRSTAICDISHSNVLPCVASLWRPGRPGVRFARYRSRPPAPVVPPTQPNTPSASQECQPAAFPATSPSAAIGGSARHTYCGYAYRLAKRKLSGKTRRPMTLTSVCPPRRSTTATHVSAALA